MLLLEIRHANVRQGLECADELRPRATGSLRDAPLLTAVLGQEDHYPVRLTELVRAEDQRIGRVQRHRGLLSYPSGARPACLTTCSQTAGG